MVFTTDILKRRKIARYEPRTLCFMFGAVTFRRFRMKKEGHSSFLPLDLSLGLEEAVIFLLRLKKLPSFMQNRLFVRARKPSML